MATALDDGAGTVEESEPRTPKPFSFSEPIFNPVFNQVNEPSGQIESENPEKVVSEEKATTEETPGTYKVLKHDIQMKMDTNTSIPIWRRSTNEYEEQQNVRMYIRDLKRLKELKVSDNEALLINASLVKSNMTHLYEEMPKEARKSQRKIAEAWEKNCLQTGQLSKDQSPREGRPLQHLSPCDRGL